MRDKRGVLGCVGGVGVLGQEEREEGWVREEEEEDNDGERKKGILEGRIGRERERREDE